MSALAALVIGPAVTHSVATSSVRLRQPSLKHLTRLRLFDRTEVMPKERDDCLDELESCESVVPSRKPLGMFVEELRSHYVPDTADGSLEPDQDIRWSLERAALSDRNPRVHPGSID